MMGIQPELAAGCFQTERGAVGMAIDYVRAKPGETIRVKIISDTIAEQRDVFAGQIVVLPVVDALDLIRCHKAIRYSEPLPSADDLDAVEEEKRIAAATDENSAVQTSRVPKLPKSKGAQK